VFACIQESIVLIGPPFLTSALDGGMWPASCPSHFTPGERASQYPLDRRLGGPQGWSGHYEEKNLLPMPGIEPQSSSL
jgi:hypothetical protein